MIAGAAAVAPEPAPPVGLYVHTPFCVSVCPYCDFVVLGGAAARGPRNRIAAFVDGLLREIDLRADSADDRFGRTGPGRPELDTLYLGGGTPSLLPAAALEAIIGRVRTRFGLAPGAEVTLEVNPGPDERGDPAAHARAGVTRYSIGAQRLDRDELRALGRRHVPADVEATVDGARRAGIGSLSLDLLYDIPGDDPDAWSATLDRALALDPDHLSIYALTLDDPDAEGLTGAGGDHLPVRPGARRWRSRARARQDDDVAADLYALASRRLASVGFRGYELSNWARPGHASRHNLAYWQRRAVEAVGPGAHAFDGRERRWNAARLDAWLAAVQPPDGGPPRPPPGGSETVDAATAEIESIVLALRTDTGVPVAAAGRAPLAAIVPWAFRERLLASSDDRLVLTLRGRLLSNEVFARLV